MSLTGEKRNSTKFNLGAFLASDFGRAAKRYLVVGGVSALADWSVFAVMLYGLELHYIAAGTISFILATGLNYYLSVRFVFGAGSRGPRQAMVLVYMVSTVGIAINLGVLTVGIDVLELHPLVAKFFATGVAVFWNFLARYFYIFK
ncbi:MAG: GtrA family protein [Alphaproteobacteria bacterium]|jgi:putative flippase GtrA